MNIKTPESCLLKGTKKCTMKYLSIITITLLLVYTTGCKKTNSTPEEVLTTFPAPGWKFDQTAKYPVSMTAVITVPTKLKTSVQPDDNLGAFIGTEVRGVGVIVKKDSATNLFYVLIHATSAEQGRIMFKYYSKKTSYMYTTTEFLPFAVDGNFGTADKPEMLDMTGVK